MVWTGPEAVYAFSSEQPLQASSTGFCIHLQPTPLHPHSHLHATTNSGSTFSPTEQDEKEFLDQTKALCMQRNIAFMKIKNARDLSSIPQSPILPNRVFRTGRMSDATSEDVHILMDEIQIKTLVDLRSPTELKEDLTLDRSVVFGNFTNLIWVERKQGIVRELAPGESFTVKKHHLPEEEGVNQKKKSTGPKIYWKQMVGGIRRGFSSSSSSSSSSAHPEDDRGTNQEVETSSTVIMDGTILDLRAAVDLAATMAEVDEDESGDTAVLVMEQNLPQDDVVVDDDDDEITTETNQNGTGTSSKDGTSRSKRYVAIYPPGSIFQDENILAARSHRKERHFVSMMNELKYIRGTLSKLRKRDIAKVIIQSPGAIVSRRVRRNVKDVFLDQINDGGLPLLNELLLRYAAPAIKYVLELCADKSRHPIAFYCTAGKDRTGVIAAIIHSVVGVPDKDIIEDYSLSANVYAEMNDHKAMVGALSQRNLNAKTFLGAPPHVMRETLETIRKNYGSVEAYLDSIGFDESNRLKLKDALTRQ